MQKNYEIYKEYLETVKNNIEFFQNYFYHSIIDFNFIKLDSILQNGILSKQTIEKDGLPNIYTHSANSSASANGSKYVSLTIYRNERELNQYLDSFALHTLTSPTLLVSKKNKVFNNGERNCGFIDEVFSEDVKVNNIKGIIIPAHIINKRVDELPCLCNDMACYTKMYLNNLINIIEDFFKTKVDKTSVYKSLGQFLKISSKFNIPQNNIAKILQFQQIEYGMDLQDVISKELASKYETKYKKPMTSLDIIKELNCNNLPVYELNAKTLKKL